jgi:hypothetical protein
VRLETDFSERHSLQTLRSVAFFGVALSPFGLLVGGAVRTASPVVGSAVLVAMVGLVVALGIVLARLNGTRRDTVVISERGVMFGSTLCPREAIRAAYFVPAVAKHKSCVRLIGDKDADLGWFVVRDQAEADLAIAALGVPPEATTRWSVLAPYGLAMAGVLVAAAAFIALGAAFHTAMLAVCGVLTAVAGLTYFMPATLHIGADGLLWKTRLAPRFIAWSEVEEVSLADRTLVLRLVRGEAVEIKLPRAREYQGTENNRIELATLTQRARSALAAFRARATTDVSARVGRLGSTTAEWVARLRARDGNFRAAPLRSDDLWSVVEDPGAEASARAGAAALLAQSSSDEDRVRLRVAADTCAEPKLRVVLSKAAQGDDVMDDLDEVGERRAITIPK